MTDFSAIAIIGGLFFMGAFVLFYCTAKINERSHEIVSGVAAGAPLSVRYRTWLLWMTWMPQWAALVAVSVIGATVFMVIARVAGHDEIGGVAHLCAGAAGFSALFFLIFGSLHIGLCISVLREAKRH